MYVYSVYVPPDRVRVMGWEALLYTRDVSFYAIFDYATKRWKTRQSVENAF